MSLSKNISLIINLLVGTRLYRRFKLDTIIDVCKRLIRIKRQAKITFSNGKYKFLIIARETVNNYFLRVIYSCSRSNNNIRTY